jgi:hypothetical protein
MKTGSFKEGNSLEYGLVTLTSISDSEWKKFSTFMNKLYPSGWEKIKGTNITYNNREKILKYIGKKQEIKYTTFLYDLTFGTDKWVKYHQKEEVKRLDKSISDVKSKNGYPKYISQLELLRNQLGNLSTSDYSKFIMIFELFVKWQKFFQFDYFYTHIKNDSWKMKHIVDTQNKPDKFKSLLKNLIMLTTNELNPDYRIYSPQEWIKDHPFNKIYGIADRPNAFNGKLFYRDFRIGNELSDPQLLIPDLIGNTIHKSIKNREKPMWLKLLKKIKRNRSYAITNKHQYYLIMGFNKKRNRKNVSSPIKAHCLAMSEI